MYIYFKESEESLVTPVIWKLEYTELMRKVLNLEKKFIFLNITL